MVRLRFRVNPDARRHGAARRPRQHPAARWWPRYGRWCSARALAGHPAACSPRRTARRRRRRHAWRRSPDTGRAAPPMPVSASLIQPGTSCHRRMLAQPFVHHLGQHARHVQRLVAAEGAGREPRRFDRRWRLERPLPPQFRALLDQQPLHHAVGHPPPAGGAHGPLRVQRVEALQQRRRVVVGCRVTGLSDTSCLPACIAAWPHQTASSAARQDARLGDRR